MIAVVSPITPAPTTPVVEPREGAFLGCNPESCNQPPTGWAAWKTIIPGMRTLLPVLSLQLVNARLICCGVLTQTVNQLGQTVQRTIDATGIIVDSTLDTAGNVVSSQTVGNLTNLTLVTETTNAAGQIVRQLTDSTGGIIEVTLDSAGNFLGATVVQQGR
jgi:hypothetical protein